MESHLHDVSVEELRSVIIVYPSSDEDEYFLPNTVRVLSTSSPKECDEEERRYTRIVSEAMKEEEWLHKIEEVKCKDRSFLNDVSTADAEEEDVRLVGLRRVCVDAKREELDELESDGGDDDDEDDEQQKEKDGGEEEGKEEEEKEKNKTKLSSEDDNINTDKDDKVCYSILIRSDAEEAVTFRRRTAKSRVETVREDESKFRSIDNVYDDVKAKVKDLDTLVPRKWRWQHVKRSNGKNRCYYMDRWTCARERDQYVSHVVAGVSTPLSMSRCETASQECPTTTEREVHRRLHKMRTSSRISRKHKSTNAKRAILPSSFTAAEM